MSSVTATANTSIATLALPPIPRTHANSPSNATFAAPPLDGSASVLQMLDWHYDHSSSHPFFIHSQSDVPASSEDDVIRTITWKETVEAVYTGAKLIRNRVQRGLGSTADVDVDGQVVGILSYSDSIPYSTTMLSVMRANFVLFPISPRNSPQAVAHLIQKVGVKHMLVGFDQSMQELMERAVEFLKTEYGYRDDQIPATSMMPLFEDLYLENGSKEKETVEKIREEIPLKRQQPQDIQFYLHSSGSTAFPKPIPNTTRGYLELSICPSFGERDLTGQTVSMHSIPMFHAMGMFHLAWVFTCGFICATFPPQLPPVQPTPENVFNGAVKTDVDYIVCVPSLVEAWSQTPSYIDWLVTRKGILFGGGPLDKGVGDRLAAQGVPLLVVYGSTECGIMSQYVPKEADRNAWDYMRFTEHLSVQFVPTDDGTYELVMVSNEHFTPRVFNTTINGANAYATSDLVIEHPQKKGYWKILGRVDSQIIHSSGEKTNPSPLESIMNQDPHVAASVMFGHGKFQAGIIIEPVKEEQFDPKDQVKLGEYRNRIWPTVEKMNDFAPQHSRIFKEMILVTSPSKPFTYTAKNTPRNNAIIKEYAPEIEAIYNSLEESTQSSIPVPAQWDLESSTEFVRAVVKKVLAIEDIGDDEDVFQRGGDSLQATWIKNSILRGLRDNSITAKVDTRESTSNFVYEHPTITSLARFIVLVAQRGTLSSLGDSEAQVERDVKAMRRMVEKYSKNFVPVKSDLPPTSNERKVVLMTGSTGGVGVHILHRLLQDETVERVYALVRNRGSGVDSPSIETKQVNAFMERGVDKDLVRSKKLVLLEANLSQEKFGLKEGVFEEVKSQVTHVIANAWRVDFNIGLSSFEADIKGLRYMVDLALARNALLIFISSIGVFQRYTYAKTRPFPEQHLPAQVASGGGYPQGKWVSEQIMQNAASQAGLRSVAVRLGQACGSPNGSWNSKEWLPALVRSAPVLGCVPGDDRLMTWIPADMAARAIKDFLDVPATETSGQTAIVHLIHPRPVRWSMLAHLIASRLGTVNVVSFEDWLAKLEEKGREDPEAEKKISALRILGFYKGLAETQAKSSSATSTTSGQAEGGLEAFGFPEIEMEKAKKLSGTLADPEVRQLGEEDVERWLRYWGLLRD
ncbi:acetyl-CoA synthetase-like protein [Dendrothele bispora CBS 962.96]|uniref:Acetyl-CoA synthetase-like protein n=1 Tax=Dendrothele bispora (strain CBS 962.96) TaxID=1314807 RepID=A0A4S8MHZ8_DENBC|nr:acetyl-CoA synthetase-like protein [Dendrothele bispora CBS 962.96]